MIYRLRIHGYVIRAALAKAGTNHALNAEIARLVADYAGVEEPPAPDAPDPGAPKGRAPRLPNPARPTPGTLRSRIYR